MTQKERFLSYIQGRIADAYSRLDGGIREAQEFHSDTMDLMIQSEENSWKLEMCILWNTCVERGLTEDEFSGLFPEF